MGDRASIFDHWRTSLQSFLQWYEQRRDKAAHFYFKLFGAFVLLNGLCFWWALLTTYPSLLVGPKSQEYVLMGGPVAILGAVFDCVSLLVTLFMIRQALLTRSNWRYLCYLSVDLVIAALATAWVLFAFMLSGWLVNQILSIPETFEARTVLYEGRFWTALRDPLNADNLRNIYFGVIMGASALLPTLFHLCLAVRSLAHGLTTRTPKNQVG